ncbi:MAG: DUF72 domain-containing protein [Sphingobacteriales bacterium]|nr:MAG: DUF72 domain-containing protein [Sphingobacteriales bacterium]
MSINPNNYYSGTSGLLLPVPNKHFYPDAFKERSRLCYYASLMNSIEVNSSFYKIPQASTIAKWAADVPEDFLFTFKLFREITHNKGLAFDPQVLEHFMHVIDHVGGKKGCLLVQFPPSIRIHSKNQLNYLMSLLRGLDPDMQWKIAFEFRHPSLYTDEIYEMLEQYQFGMVLHDKAPANTPFVEQATNFIYLRFHGPGGNYRGSYPDDVMYEYAGYVTDWLRDSKKVFVYFNNTMGSAIENMNMLKSLVLSPKS